MKKTAWLKTFVTIVLTTLIVSVIFILTKGCPLTRLPRMEHIDRVVITNMERGMEKEVTDSENIELAVKLIHFLNYVPFSAASESFKPLITITYMMDDGTEIYVSANNTDVFLNNKGHRLKDGKIFVNLTNGVFFFEEYAADDSYNMVTDLSNEEVEPFAETVKQQFLNHDWKSLSENLQYPITIDGVTCNNPDEFLSADFEASLNPVFFEKLEEEDCREMFCNWQGIMLGETGQVWLNEYSGTLKISAVNGLTES